MATHSSIFAHPFLPRSHAHPSSQASASTRHTLSGSRIIAAAALLLTILFATPQAFAATTQHRMPQKAALPSGWSCGNPQIGHCYGQEFWGGANAADTRISLNTSLSGGGTWNDLNDLSFVTTEMWLQSSSATYWVEVGVISQYGEYTGTYPYYFWADNRPNGGGFSFHSFAYIPSDAESPLFRISRIDSSDWSVVIQDNSTSYTGTSTANSFDPGSGNIVVGTELHNNYQTAYEPGIEYGNNRWDDGGGWQYQTNDGVGTNINPPVSAGWGYLSDPVNSNTGGIWYTCIPGYGC